MPETLTTAVFHYPANCVEQMPDFVGNRYRFPFRVSSSSSNKTYIISYDNASGAGYWTCSCKGNTFNGQCRHLDAAGLLGRKCRRSPLPGKELPKAAPRMFPPMKATGIRRLAENQARKAPPVVNVPQEDAAFAKKAEEIFAAGATDEILDMLK